MGAWHNCMPECSLSWRNVYIFFGHLKPCAVSCIYDILCIYRIATIMSAVFSSNIAQYHMSYLSVVVCMSSNSFWNLCHLHRVAGALVYVAFCSSTSGLLAFIPGQHTIWYIIYIYIIEYLNMICVSILYSGSRPIGWGLLSVTGFIIILLFRTSDAVSLEYPWLRFPCLLSKLATYQPLPCHEKCVRDEPPFPPGLESRCSRRPRHW